ncbi:MAG: replicative DNA helicase [Chlamydiae bacterium CG10_big_fil_rev_8_21_14_0_10_35_9]|nr:MAG: replicative DNA helicase [Chlamydiae bacterium CG10_big_fil_rev_8_21_14_0_10_35_9]
MKEKPRKIKSAPNSKESEMMVLGSMLTSINSLNVACDGLDSEDFYYSEHQIIFKVVQELYKKDKPADIHIVSEELKRIEKLEDVGGISYLTTLAQYVGTSAYIEEYIKLVKEKALLRRMIDASEIIEKKALEETENVFSLLDEAQSYFYQISQSTNSGSATHVKDLLSGIKAESKLPYLKELEARQEKFQELGAEGVKVIGIPTHFTDLDKMINGLNPSNLMILAARPAMGKSALAMGIVENICFKNEIPVGVFSLEMSAEQLLHRVICSQAEVESEKILTGAINGHEYQRIVACVNSMQKHTLLIDDQPGLKITDLRARARRMKESYNIGFLMIDYLQLISGSGNQRAMENRQIEISEISRMLKNLARELNVPILCLSQLSRKVEERQGHRPMMSDLRESGCLSGDTVIKNAETGELHTIKELAERETQTPIFVHAIDEKLKLGKHKLIKAFFSGRKTIYKLTTRSGRSIKASANHPFRTINGWERLDALTKGTHIAIPRELNQSNPISVSDGEAILLGHLLGDGCILPSQPYHYTSADLENINIVANSAKNLFQIKEKVIEQKNWYHLNLKSPTHTAHDRKHPITDWYEKLGIERVRAPLKKIPKAIFTSKKSTRRLFIKHLWSTDGNISSKLINKRKPSVSIYYASSSEELSKSVQHLLLSVGIQSQLKVVPSNKGYRDMHHVYVYGKHDQSKFLSEIGCHGSRGKSIPSFLEKLNEIKTNPNLDIIPKDIWHTHIKKEKEANQLGWRDICQKLNTSYCGSTLFKSGLSRQRMNKLSSALNSETLKNFAESGVYWDEIISIKEIGEEEVYDATVENVHNFVANDIIVHNSLEQDSDLVMFLLRSEYYDPYDKPGQAELIVAKNRHGSIGTINLTYRKEFVQFANFTSDDKLEDSNEEAFSDFSP